MRESVSVHSSSSAALREQMVTFIDKMRENGADTEAEIVERYMEAAEQEGVTLTRDEVMDELAADFAGDMLDDADLFAKFSKENRTAAQKLLDSLKEFLAKVKTAFTGKYRDMAAREAYGKDFAELEDIAKQWQAAFDAAERQAEKTKTAAGEGDGAKYQIKQFPNGMKYVQADRQVLFGNDPKAWSEQLESYINGKIRNHEDVRLIAEDGDVLLLTSKSAGKLSSIYDNNGRTLDEKAFERKANAAAHIDELIKVSERGGKTVLDFGGRHGDMAKDGWNYRTAYFMDFDGKYYRTRISVALGKDGSIVYNIGEMQERSTPQINGSSGNSGAQRGNASGISILTDGENVKPQFSLGYLKSDVGFFCFRVFEKGGCSKVLCGVFSFRAVRGKAVAVKFYVGFPIRSDLCRKRHRHLTEDADAFLLECSGNQLNNSSSFCWSVPSLAYGSASNCRKLCLMSFVSSLKPRMYESAM